jgi:hypothetical protein
MGTLLKDEYIRPVALQVLPGARLPVVQVALHGKERLGGGRRMLTTDVGGLPRMPRCGRFLYVHLL